MRLLQFATRKSWPLDTGAKLRNYCLARGLSENLEVTLLAFEEGLDEKSSVNNPRRGSFYQSVVTVPRDRGYTPSKIIKGALGSTPLPLLNYTTPAMKSQLASLLAKQSFDVVQLESIHLFAYLSILKSAKSNPLIVLDWHNIESELMSRYSERESNILRRTYARRASQQIRKCEANALATLDAHVSVSDVDAAKLRQRNHDSLIIVVENGVEVSYYSDDELTAAYSESNINKPAKANRLVFVGSMDYHANIDAVASFAADVWPALHKKHSDLIFTIVGRNPPAEVSRLADIAGIEVTGTVTDVRPYYHDAVAALIPLRVGGGSRLKILEAMAAGVPIICTKLGAEGLAISNGEDILLADTGQEMIDAVNAITENPALANNLRLTGRALVESKYDWSILSKKLFGFYCDMLKRRAA